MLDKPKKESWRAKRRRKLLVRREMELGYLFMRYGYGSGHGRNGLNGDGEVLGK